MANGRAGRGGLSPYVYNIQVPRGGANEVSVPIDMGRNYIQEAFDAFSEAKNRRRQRALEDADLALKIAEMQGEVTPDLQRRITAPLGREAHGVAQVAGGLGRLIGIDTDLGETVPFEPTRPLQTQYERGIEAEERKAQQGLLKHEREMEKLGYMSDLEVGKKRRMLKDKTISEGLTVEDRKEIARIKKAGKGQYGTNDPRKVLQWRLLTGDIKYEDLSPSDFMVLGNYYASMTPEQRSKDAMGAAAKLVEAAMAAGEMKNYTPEEIDLMVEAVATEYIDTQDKLIGKVKGSTGGKGGRKPLGEIMTPGR